MTLSHPYRSLLLSLLIPSSLAGAGAAPKRTPPPAPPSLIVHYMAWYEAKPVSQVWGWHWTMNHFNPEIVERGRRQIASHDTPLIGPYDSSDPHVLEYHALLMKIAGIDGAVIDWYGTTDYLDYALVHRNAMKWIETLKRFGLRYAVCYEDQSVKHMVEGGFATKENAPDRGREHLRWLDAHAFGDPLYLKWKGAPLLLVFGPQYFGPQEWKALLGGLSQPPALFTLDVRRDPALGSFSWLPMWKSGGKTLTPAMLDAYLDDFYAAPGEKIGVAFPGFHDVYGEAGLHPSYGFLDRGEGTVFKQTLGRALKEKSPFVQVATWNDFGEGTSVEPAREYGYRYLEILQNEAQSLKGRAFPYRPSDLRLPLRIYRMRESAGTDQAQKKIDEVVRTMKQGRMDRARALMSRLKAGTVSKPSKQASP